LKQNKSGIKWYESGEKLNENRNRNDTMRNEYYVREKNGIPERK